MGALVWDTAGSLAMVARAKPFMDRGDRPRYIVHYRDGADRDRGSAMRWFDEPLAAGQEIRGPDGLSVVERVEESEAFRGLGHSWAVYRAGAEPPE